MRVSIEREGPRVIVAMRADGATATLNMHRRGAATLAAQLSAITGPEDEDSELECELRGELETHHP